MSDPFNRSRVNRRNLLKGVGAAAILAPAGGALLASCSIGGGDKKKEENGNTGAGVPSSVSEIAEARGLTPDDITRAVKTYVPGGKHDEYMIFASGGHGGQVLVIGVPSMRLLKLIGTFTPEPWQGFGFSDDTKAVLAEGAIDDKVLGWADTHHPGLSETNGEYDGQYLFINDKANARLAVIDLRDFETKQIVKNPHFISNHGGAFVTPNTEYITEGAQYAVPWGWEYAPLSDYKTDYRGAMSFWKFDREKGRLDQSKSFTVEVPPYWNDLSDCGKGPSEGWMFSNTFNTELAIGGNRADGSPSVPPVEAGASQNDMDLMTIIDWKKAEKVFEDGKAKDLKGMALIDMKTAVAEGILYQVPEPKSPHGVDVTPDGKFIVVAGKLDPHVTIYSFEKIQAAIAKGGFETDVFGVPVLKYEDCMEAQVELGLGPLHTQFDDQGYAYTSLFLDSAIAKWKLGEAGKPDTWKMMDKLSVHYNVGHLSVCEGDTVKPKGKYLIALNKWAIDRFTPVGPLHPQNFQLIDITGEKMDLLYDSPIGVGEPHYVQTIAIDKLKVWTTYPEVGWDPIAQAPSPVATLAGKESVERDGNKVTINMTSIRSHFTPDTIEVNKDDEITLHITNVEMAQDSTHGFAFPGQHIQLSIEPGETTTVTFTADHAGVYPFYCTEFCSALHLEMMGYFVVKPA
ncbi:MAG TPA: Sec-dependent nitrous-oxide reductase [Thermomicrobiales bacterium]|jgi:nitrous-oxide reductase|nr:cytochrome C [Chloroflexota bacterium]HQZ91092.1 Sec-dependent nitrous-oxide reductase [Thermomicrobiales bacterium]HRA31028.1 Sec-dependent nitrous-oxide reductase [Thermomicrobiales bacterium]